MDGLVKIAVINHEVEAQILDDILAKRNIPHLVRTYHSAAYDGLFQFQKGWGALYAPDSYREEILEIIADLRKADDTVEPF